MRIPLSLIGLIVVFVALLGYAGWVISTGYYNKWAGLCIGVAIGLVWSLIALCIGNSASNERADLQ